MNLSEEVRSAQADRISSFLFVLKNALVVLWVCCTLPDILQSERTENNKTKAKT